MAEKLIHVYDTRTNEKLAQRVPAVWLKLFPHLSETPKSKARPVPAPFKNKNEEN